MSSMPVLSRKRTASSRSPEAEQHYHPIDQNRNTSELKKTRTTSDLESLGLIPAQEAWDFNIQDLFACPHTPAHQDSTLNNTGNYQAGRSLFVLCVVGHLDLQFQLLCAALPSLLALSPSMQALILRSTPPPVPSAALPTIHPPAGSITPSPIIRLGLLHPLGGGQQALDAIVLLDPAGKRRLLLPFGWGAGQHVLDAAGGKMIRERLMELLADGVKTLESEMSSRS